MLIQLLPTSTVSAVEVPVHYFHFYSAVVNNTIIITIIMFMTSMIVLEKSQS
jgi:hypothetical protein